MKRSEQETSRPRSPRQTRSPNFSGDCTEHAVLAAAMCRAVEVPSRVAIGLVYVEKESAFGSRCGPKYM